MKYIFITFGSLFVILGAIGIFLPVLPTTPFLLLAAALYVRSSERLYSWLLRQRLFGPYIRNFTEHKTLPLRIKIISIVLMWASILFCILSIAQNWLARILLLTTAIGVTACILSFKTLPGMAKSAIKKDNQ